VVGPAVVALLLLQLRRPTFPQYYYIKARHHRGGYETNKLAEIIKQDLQPLGLPNTKIKPDIRNRLKQQQNRDRIDPQYVILVQTNL